MKKFNEFVNENNLYNYELNEGLFDIFKKMFSKINQYIKKVKGGLEIEKIYKEYLGYINKEFQKQGITELNIGDSTEITTGTTPTTAATTAATVKKENLNHIIINFDSFLNEEIETQAQALAADEKEEEEETSKKMTVQKLKQKTVLMDQIIKKFKDMALKKMDAVLKRYGGAEKNPKLSALIDNKKDQFELDYLNSKIKFLETAGDKSLLNKVKAERDILSKDLNQRWLNLDKAGNPAEGGTFAIGSYYRFKDEGGIKTIKIVKQSDLKDKIVATYMLDSDGKLGEQNFTIKNIDTEFKPKPKVKYNYYSQTNNAIIPVRVKSYDKNKNEVVLVSEKGNEFAGNIGALRDEIKETT